MSAYEFINLLKLILIAKKKNLMWTNHGMLNIEHQWESEENIRQKWNLSLSFHNSAS